MQRRLVSILIPTLAKGAHAGRLAPLKALLGQHLPTQSHQDYEAIVYCDGRNNDVERMIAGLADLRIRVYWTADTDNSAWGHPQTRRGIDVARGDYFVRINDDSGCIRTQLIQLIIFICGPKDRDLKWTISSLLASFTCRLTLMFSFIFS